TVEEQTGTTDADVEIDFRIEPAPSEIETLNFPAGERVLRRTFTHSISGTPHQVMTSYMPTRIAEAAGLRDPEDEIPGKTTVMWLRDAGVDVQRQRLLLEARLPTPSEIDQLALPNEQIPVIVHKGILYSSEPVAVEAHTVLVVADLVTY